MISPASGPETPVAAQLAPAYGPLRPLQTNALIAQLGVGVAVAVAVADLLVRPFAVATVVEFTGGVDGVLVVNLIFGVLALLGVLVAGIAVIVWMYKARKNTELFPGARNQHSAGWAVGGWFVPIVNLVFPAQIMYDIARNSGPETDRRRAFNSVLTWWLCWNIGTLTTVAVPLLAAHLDPFTTGLRVLILLALAVVSAVLTVVSGVVLIRLVRRISRLQAARPIAAPLTPPPPPAGFSPSPNW
jgi:hypothetical protein